MSAWTGSTLSTLMNELNGRASIGETLKFQFVNIAKTIIEQLRPWMLLRARDDAFRD